ncbi:MAG TPA: MotA/TolQ/ExbB proton channel family protein [Candidatus Latescibacteria bacterium]|jgi:biopolymer transport protein ExbB/biopolymer transport protein TolQ|nr:flagellar motor protein MotA [Gemmatimonadaceae bacterium]MDP6018472.1 MotA/TolQ/ExbB proton channel family protein [Candidatus Latescibacterota bacterium]HJP31892.1 MotA/TolQ/ExbB proton channel family protein [Candidatus Latescibacterota bacterium]
MELVSELWGSMAITGKVVVLVLIALSIYSYVVMVDRFVALRTNGQGSSDLSDQLGSSTDAGQILSAARTAGEAGNNSLAAIVEAGLQEFESLQSDGQPEAVVVEAVDESVSRQLDVAILNLRSRLSGMATISGVAPFLGLFGTVTGLISAFRGIAETGSGGLATVSGGISEALVTTVIGLFVAIPALWAYNFFMNKIDVMAVELDNAATRIVSRTVRHALRASAA